MTWQVIQSIILGTVVTFGSLFVLTLGGEDKDALAIFGTIIITSTIIFCTYRIIDEIQKLKEEVLKSKK